MTDIVGGCLCGRVRYRGSAEPLFTANCHCKHCQKTTGTSFSIVLGLPRDSLVLEGGPLTTYRDTGESGMAVQRKFCGTCGSPVLSEVEAAPTLVFLKGGTLDDTSQGLGEQTQPVFLEARQFRASQIFGPRIQHCRTSRGPGQNPGTDYLIL